MSRPTWDDVWMETALIVAYRSLCVRAQVGAVIVTADNRVQAVSFNGAPDRFDVSGEPCTSWCARATTGDTSSDYSRCAAVHAEANALMRSDWSQIQGGTIYSSGAVCANCAKLIIASGLDRVVHRVLTTDTHRDPSAVEAQIRSSGIEVVRWASGE